MAHVYNPNYSGGRDWEDHDSRPSWTKVSKAPTSTNKLGRVVCTYIQVRREAYVGRSQSRLALGKKVRPLPEK
jgi:hypothetical protein